MAVIEPFRRLEVYGSSFNELYKIYCSAVDWTQSIVTWPSCFNDNWMVKFTRALLSFIYFSLKPSLHFDISYTRLAEQWLDLSSSGIL